MRRSFDGCLHQVILGFGHQPARMTVVDTHVVGEGIDIGVDDGHGRSGQQVAHVVAATVPSPRRGSTAAA